MIRLAEALAGHRRRQRLPLEKSLRNAVIASRFAEALGLRGADASDAYYTALLRSLGCTSFSFETAALLGGDDIAFHGLWDRLDPGHPGEFLRMVVAEMGAWAPPAQRAKAVATFLRVGRKVAPVAGRSACEVSASPARRLGLPDGVREGLDQVYERWEGPRTSAQEAGVPWLARRDGRDAVPGFFARRGRRLRDRSDRPGDRRARAGRGAAPVDVRP